MDYFPPACQETVQYFHNLKQRFPFPARLSSSIYKASALSATAVLHTEANLRPKCFQGGSFRRQSVQSQNLAKQQEEPGGGSTLSWPLLPLGRRNHRHANTPSPVCKRPVSQTTASCPKLNPTFSHTFQKTEGPLELPVQSSFLAPILAAICPDQGIFFMAEECVAQHVSALPSSFVLHPAELK